MVLFCFERKEEEKGGDSGAMRGAGWPE